MKISFLKIIFALVFCLSPFVVSASSTDNMSGWAWSSNIGWISFNCTNIPSSCPTPTTGYGVNEDTSGNITGYAWSPNIGWISFNRVMTGNPPSNDINPGTGAIAMVSTTGVVTGWAKALSADGNGWDGWISLSGTATNGSPYGVTLTDKGSTLPSQYTCTTDCAWGSDVVGWVDFSGVIIGPGTGNCSDGIQNGDETGIDIGGRCNNLPTVSIPKSAGITATSATLGATIDSLGNPPADCNTGGCSGIVYSRSQNPAPTLGGIGSTTVPFPNNISVGPYTVPTVTGLLSGTTYYFRGFATNSVGTGYSIEGTFTTTGGTCANSALNPPTCTLATITFNGNGSTGGSTVSQTITTNTSVNLTPNGFIKTGYSFTGWNTLANGMGTSYADGASYTIGTSNVTLYAKWATSISINGQCSNPQKHYNCSVGTSSNHQNFPSKVTWDCVGTGTEAVTDHCSEQKGPGFIEN